jgi:peptidylprolyl isomerase
MKPLLALAGALLSLAASPKPGWTPLDPAELLVVDTTKGRIVVAMAPELAPKAVERVKLLAREGVYDGLQFHRVIEGFVDQTGNPNNRDGGTSSHPDLPPEFSFRIAPARAALVRRAADGVEGFAGAVPIAGALTPDGQLRGWGAYCAGVAGMGRQEGIGTANSEIFFMRAPARRLDHDYTVWGRVVQGLEVVRAVKVGEPPADSDRMLRVRVAAELPPAERPRLEMLDPAGAAFQAKVRALRAAKGADVSVCDLEVPVRAAP